MADAYQALDDRVRAILFEGRGADGALGVDALQKSIPAARYRAERDGCPLTDPSYQAEYFDRAVRLEWAGDQGDTNPLDNAHVLEARLLVHVGIAAGPALAPWVYPAGLEDAEAAVLRPYPRGMNAVRRIVRALECPDLVRDGTEVDPVPIGITREGATTSSNLGGGRMVFTTAFLFLYRILNTDDHDP